MPSGMWSEARGIPQTADEPEGLSFTCANTLKPAGLKESLPSDDRIGILKDLRLTDACDFSSPE